MRVTDLPVDILEQVFKQLSYAALGRIVSTRTRLSLVAGRVAAQRVNADQVLTRNSWWLRVHGNEAECCWECLAPDLLHRKFSHTRGHTYIKVCATCAREVGGFRELTPRGVAINLAKQKLRQAGAKSREAKALAEIVAYDSGMGNVRFVWAREFERGLSVYVSRVTRRAC